MNANKSAVVLLSQILSAAVGALTAIFISRWLGPSNFGIYSYCFGLASVFSGLGDLGFHQVYLKRIAEHGDEGRFTANFIAAKLVLTGMVVLMTWLALLWAAAHGQVRGSVEAKTVALVLVGYALTNLLVIPASVYLNGQRQMAKSSLISIVQPLLMLAMVLLFLRENRTPEMLALLSLSQPLSAALLIRFWLRRPVLIRPRFDRDVFRDYLGYVAPVALSSLAAGAYAYIDRPIIKGFLPYADLGYFVIAQRFGALLLLLSGSTMSIQLAAMSRAYYEGKTGDVERIARRATKYLSLITVPLAVLSAHYAKTIISLTVGSAYLPAVVILQILMLRVVLMTYNRTTSVMLNAIEKLNLISMLSIGWCVLGVGLDFVLIPRVLAGHRMLGLGAAGVAVKDVIVDVVALVLNNALAYSYIKARFYWRVLSHLVAGAAFWGTSTWLDTAVHVPLVQMLVGGAAGFAVYCAVLASLRELRGEELRTLWRTIDPRRLLVYTTGELKGETAPSADVA